MKNEAKFKEYIATLCEIHDRAMSKLLTDIYWKILEPFNDEECEQAFKDLILSSKFFPKPAEFIEALRGKTEHRATLAWLTALESVKRIGNYQSVRFSDPVIHSVIQAMGGWEQFCMMESRNELWKRKEFEKLYETIASRNGKHPEYLPGTHEMENFRTGHGDQGEIVSIGNEPKKVRMLN